MGEFKELPNGYKYKLNKELDYDDKLCNAEIEVVRYGSKTENLWEIQRYIKELIEDIMNSAFKENHNGFNVNGNLVQISGNIYSLDWTIKMKKNKYELLMKYCIGNQIKVNSGELKGQVGFYFVKEEGKIIKRINEYILIHGDEHSLKSMAFRFVEDEEQLTYEDIMDKI